MEVSSTRHSDTSSKQSANDAKILAVIVNWNKRTLLIECLRSLMVERIQDMTVCVIDNNSNDDSIKAVARQFPEVETITNDRNVGFAGACQQALTIARRRKTAWLIVMNNDIVLQDGAIRKLVTAAESDPTIGIATPQIVFYSQPDHVWWYGGTIDPHSGKTGHLGHRNTRMAGTNLLVDTAYANGCMMLISRRVLDLPLDFEQAYFAYYEDADFSIRVREAGLRTVVVPSSVIRHHVSASTGGENSPGFVYFQTKNRLIFVKRNMRAVLPLVVLRGTFFEVPRQAASFLHGRKVEHVISLVKGFASGLLNIPNFKTLSTALR